jgi:hypothetical protein
MDQLERSGVVAGEIRAMTDAQHGSLLQLVVEQAHDATLAVFVERGCRLVEKDPTRFVQEQPRALEFCTLSIPAISFEFASCSGLSI